MKQIFVDYNRCMGCRSCEIACSLEHSRSENLLEALFETPKSKPRIRIEQANSFSYPVHCQHCEDAPCIMACPTGAMRRDRQLDAVLVDEDRCIGCWMCTLVCPFGAISTSREPLLALKCDLCKDRQSQGLNPACVNSCPTRALVFSDVEELSKQRRLDYITKVVEESEPPSYPTIDLWRAGKVAV